MRMTKEGTVYQMTFMPRFFPVNCYFIEEEDGLTLIDAALPSSGKAILAAAGRIGKPINRIVLTHAHYDHVGSLDTLKQQLPEVPIHISKRDSRLMAGDRTLDPGEPQTPIKGGIPAKLKTKEADLLLQEGDRVGSLLVLASPGHTPGSMSFLDTRSNALIAGDAFQIRGGTAVTGQFKPLFPFPAFATWNKAQALESARKLRKLGPELLAVGHGNLMRSPAQALDRAIDAAERNLAK